MAEPLRLTEAHPDQHLKVARRLIKSKDYAAARRLIDQPLTDPRDESRRLRVLAEAWSAEGRHADAADCLRTAHTLRPNSYKIAIAYLRELVLLDNVRAALRVYGDLAPRDMQRREALWEMHMLYDWFGWRGHADEVRGGAKVDADLPERLAIGIRRIIRPQLLRMEHREQRDLLRQDRYLKALEAINYQSMEQRYELHAEVDRAVLAGSRVRTLMSTLTTLLRAAYPVVMGGAFAWLLLFVSDEGATATRLSIGLVGAGLMYLAGRGLWNMPRTYTRAAVAAGSLAFGGLITGILLLRLASGNELLVLAGIASLGGATIVALAVVGGLVLGGFDGYVQQQVSRRNARGTVVAQLAEVVTRIEGKRRPELWLRKLEAAARILEREVPRQVRTFDQRTAEWLSGRCAGAAEALRHMKRHVLSPAGNGTEHLSRLLRQQLAALATDNWHGLVWREPPGKRARSRKDTLISVLRVAVVALLPAVSLFAVSPWLDFGDGIFRWARLVVFGWAVLSVLVALDPGVRERIELAVLLARGAGDKGKRERGQ